jgi:hypothetical protein
MIISSVRLGPGSGLAPRFCSIRKYGLPVHVECSRGFCGCLSFFFMTSGVAAVAEAFFFHGVAASLYIILHSGLEVESNPEVPAKRLPSGELACEQTLSATFGQSLQWEFRLECDRRKWITEIVDLDRVEGLEVMELGTSSASILTLWQVNQTILQETEMCACVVVCEARV